MKIGWQLTKLLQNLSGLLFLAHPVVLIEPSCIVPSSTSNYT